jgi:hypothetical protein
MSLDGLRAWIGEVERKLAMRTRVFLVLVAIAVGGAGAAIVLAADNDGGEGGGASESKVEALETRVDELSAGGGPEAAALESRISELESRLGELEAETQGSKQSGTAEGGAKQDEPGGTESPAQGEAGEK